MHNHRVYPWIVQSTDWIFASERGKCSVSCVVAVAADLDERNDVRPVWIFAQTMSGEPGGLQMLLQLNAMVIQNKREEPHGLRHFVIHILYHLSHRVWMVYTCLETGRWYTHVSLTIGFLHCQGACGTARAQPAASADAKYIKKKPGHTC